MLCSIGVKGSEFLCAPKFLVFSLVSKRENSLKDKRMPFVELCTFVLHSEKSTEVVRVKPLEAVCPYQTKLQTPCVGIP